MMSAMPAAERVSLTSVFQKLTQPGQKASPSAVAHQHDGRTHTGQPQRPEREHATGSPDAPTTACSGWEDRRKQAQATHKKQQ